LIELKSAFIDYYDCAPKLIGTTKMKKVPNVFWNREIRISSHHPPFYLQQDSEGIYAKPISSNEEKRTLPNPPLVFDKEGVQIGLLIFGFCGKTYVYALRNGTLKRNVGVFGKDILELFSDDQKHKTDIEGILKQFHGIENKDMFTLYGTPIFVFGLNETYRIGDKPTLKRKYAERKTKLDIFELQNVVVNPHLESFHFNKVKNHISTYIDIANFIKKHFNSKVI
jgi:hypothetical protein